MKRLIITVLALTFTLAASHSVQAALLAYEGFDYTDGSNLNNQGAVGAGWADSWSAPGGGTGWKVVSPGLTYTDLTTSGNTLQTGTAGGRADRALDVSSTGPFASYADPTNTFLDRGGDLWFSVLMIGQTSGNTFNGFEFSDVTTGNQRYFVLRAQNGNWTIGDQSGETTGIGGATNIGAVDGTNPDFFVLRIGLDSAADSDEVDVWFNPTIAGSLGAPTESFTGLDLQLAVQRVADFGAPLTVDEIRWGDSADAVLSIPEPTSVALISIGALLLLRRRRRLS